MRLAHLLAGVIFVCSYRVGCDCGGGEAALQPCVEVDTDGGAGGGGGGAAGGMVAAGGGVATGGGGALAAGGGVATGGGDPSPQPLTCAWMQGNNCWKQAATQISRCGIDRYRDGGASLSGIAGALTVDAGRCAYPDGLTVQFDLPFTWIPSSLAPYGISVTDPTAGTCLRFDGQYGLDAVITTDAGPVHWASGPNRVSIVCPDGTAFATDAASAVLGGCIADGSVPGYPTFTVISQGSRYRLELGGTSAVRPGIFDCQ